MPVPWSSAGSRTSIRMVGFEEGEGEEEEEEEESVGREDVIYWSYLVRI